MRCLADDLLPDLTCSHSGESGAPPPTGGWLATPGGKGMTAWCGGGGLLACVGLMGAYVAG